MKSMQIWCGGGRLQILGKTWWGCFFCHEQMEKNFVAHAKGVEGQGWVSELVVVEVVDMAVQL